MPGPRHRANSVPIFAGILVVLLAGLGECWVVRQWWYNHLLLQKRDQSAIQAWPGNPEAWRRWAMRHPESPQAISAARHAVQLAPANWRNWYALALAQNQWGHTKAAQHSLNAMVARAHLFLPRWLNANQALLQGQSSVFWRRAASTLAIAPPSRMPKALAQCRAFANGQNAPLRHLLRQSLALAQSSRQRLSLNLAFLAAFGSSGDSSVDNLAWRELVSLPLTRPQLARVSRMAWRKIASFLAQNHPRRALALWHRGLSHKWFNPAQGPMRSQFVTGGNFSRFPSPHPFAWSVCQRCGVWFSRDVISAPLALGRAATALRRHFGGIRSQSAVLAWQPVILPANTGLTLSAVSLIPISSRHTGLSLRVVGPVGNSCVRLPLPPSSAPLRSSIYWLTGPGVRRDVLQLVYARPLGQMPLTATVKITAVSLRPGPGIGPVKGLLPLPFNGPRAVPGCG